MLTERFLQTRTDRVIALARLVVALVAVGAVWLEGLKLANAGLTYSFLLGYVAFAAASVLTSGRQARAPGTLALIRHLVDIAIIAFLVFSTQGPASPFFVLFTFVLVSATIRWRWKGAMWTSTGLLALLLISAAAYPLFVPGIPTEPERLLIRVTHIAVAGALLVYFGFHQERMAEELARLSAWQADPLATSDTGEFLSDCASHAAEVFGAPRVLIVLIDPEEPTPVAAYWRNGTLQRDRLTGTDGDAPVPEALRGKAFLQQPGTEDVLVLESDGRVHSWMGDPIAPALRQAYAIGQMLSAPVYSERVNGRLFVLDQPVLPAEDLTLAGFVAAQIGAGLDRMDALEALRRSTATEERLQIARDLHDGALQTLAATGLRLEGLAKLAEHEPTTVPSRITALQDWLVGEQRELRRLISRLRPGPAPTVKHNARADVLALTESLKQQWGMNIDLTTKPADLQLSPDLAFHLHQLIREAAANAARHGGATEMSIELTQADSALTLKMRDNGSGMPQRGLLTQDECAKLKIGPRSLRERVVGLGGSLTVTSCASGLTLDIDIPLELESRS